MSAEMSTEMSTEKKIVVLTGGTGFIGSALTIELLKKGYRVRILTRDASRFEKNKDLPVEYFSWNPVLEEAPLEALKDAWGVIHLAGEPVAGSRWNASRKKAILESRSLGTR
ncbi:MAG: NAD-dependent epimerase/dehydratase family protein, partial [bacterium]